MIIKSITVKNFGSVKFFETALGDGLNVIDTRFISEISKAIEILICSCDMTDVHKMKTEQDTLLSAEVLINDKMYFVKAKPTGGCEVPLKLSVTDSQGADATESYLYTMCRFSEQDVIESFDGQDKSIPMQLSKYRNPGEYLPVGAIANSKNYITYTKTFRRLLLEFIRNFEPETIRNQKSYLAYINNQGIFDVMHPEVSSKLYLSETEEKLFRYICFLNIAEFWEEVEKTRDIHYEKKPLIVRNFLEFLDFEVDIKGLMTRTLKLNRQIIILTR